MELVVRLGVELVVGFVLGFLMQLCAAIVQAGGEGLLMDLGHSLKMIVVVLILLAAGGWMLETLKDFTRYLFTLM